MITLSMNYALSVTNTKNLILSEVCRTIKKKASNFGVETRADVNLFDNTLCVTFHSFDDKSFGLRTAIELQNIVASALGDSNTMSFLSGYFH